MVSKAMEFYNEGKRNQNGRQNAQLGDILAYIKEQMEKCNEIEVFYENIIYDAVRERLEEEGFSIQTVSHNGNPTYLIKVKDTHKAEPFPDEE